MLNYQLFQSWSDILFSYWWRLKRFSVCHILKLTHKYNKNFTYRKNLIILICCSLLCLYKNTAKTLIVSYIRQYLENRQFPHSTIIIVSTTVILVQFPLSVLNSSYLISSHMVSKPLHNNSFFPYNSIHNHSESFHIILCSKGACGSTATCWCVISLKLIPVQVS
jgi:hypothetical protein